MNGGRGAGCIYELRQQPSIDIPSVSHDSTSGSPRSRVLPSQTSANGTSKPPISPPSDLPLPNSSEPNSFFSTPPAPCERPSTPATQLPWELSPCIRNEIALGPPSNVSVVQKIHDTVECIPRSVASSFTILPSIHFRTIPRPLRVPLSLIPPEHVQISCIAGNDLDMTLYVFLQLQNFRGG